MDKPHCKICGDEITFDVSQETWWHQEGYKGHPAMPRDQRIEQLDAAHEPTNIDYKRGNIVSRAQADIILHLCYPITALIDLEDSMAVYAANLIAKAVDEARGTI